MAMAAEVQAEMERECASLSRREAIEKAAAEGALFVVVDKPTPAWISSTSFAPGISRS